MRNSTNLETPMNQYNALKQALKPHLRWHGARREHPTFVISNCT